MNYFEKYLKYKSKYLRLKNNFYMIGGDKPVSEILKNINLFSDKPELESFFNPVYGFILNETGFIINHYEFLDLDNVDGDNKNIFTLVHKLFIKIDVSNEIKLTKRLFEVDTRDIGKLLAFLYLRYIKFKDLLNVINNLINKIDKLIKNIQSFTTKPNFKKLRLDKKTELCSLKDSIDANIKLLYESDFSSITIEDVQFEKPEYANRYINNSFLNALIKYKAQLEKIINKPDFKSTYVNSLIFKNINLETIDENTFRVILAVGWWISNNKQNIRYYYEGLNEILPSNMQVTIPEYFDDELFTRSELSNGKPENFELALAITYNNHVSLVKIIEYEIATIHNLKFPDCGESSLRNFINIISYNKITDTFNIDKLKSIGANEIILNYYSIFDTINKHVSDDEQLIYGKSMNARNAWAVVVSNIQYVAYKNQENLQNGDIYKYEILSGLSNIIANDKNIVNMLAVLQNLFTSIKNWSDFNTLLSNIDVNLDIGGHGTIDFEANKLKYTWKFMNGHYAFEQKKYHYEIDLSNLTKTQTAYINCITSHNINDLFLNYFYFIKHEDRLLTEKINSEIYHMFNENDYQRILNYARKNFKREHKICIVINFSKLKNISKFILSEFLINVIYDESGSRNYENIITFLLASDKYNELNLEKFINLKTLDLGKTTNNRIDISMSSSMNLQNLTSGNFLNSYSTVDKILSGSVKLKKLTFGIQFNQPLSTLLNSLINLQHLEFGYEFDQELGASLDSLVNLQILMFGIKFNKELGTSLNSLEKLQSLTFGGYFNQELGTSLNSLVNLQSLKLGVRFNQELSTSLNSLVNLQTLTFSANFNRELGTSLNSLVNLQSLTFSSNFNQKLGTSLNSLINLQNLTFAENFNQELDTSLNSLVNLQNLKFGNNFNQELGTSLNSLVYLKSLMFGKTFNQELATSLNSLVKLESLTFAGNFNKELGTSLSSLVKLQNLSLGLSFNKELGSSLSSLVNLQNLSFGSYFDQKLGTSLNSLVNLQNLSFDYSFNQELGTSLNSLVNLQNLKFGKTFNQELGTSLNSLVNLQSLILGERFSKKLSTSLDSLINLQSLTLGYFFNKKLDSSLNSLTNLQSLVFSDNFDQELSTSLNSLINLKSLTFVKNFNQELGTSLNSLVNLQSLKFGVRFNQELGTSLNSLVNLQSLTFGHYFNQELATSLNSLVKLQNLAFDDQFNQKLGTSLDSLVNLQSLKFGYSFNQKLNKSLDSLVNLKNLIFGHNFNQDFDTSLNSLVKIEKITLGEFYDKKFSTSLDKLVNLKKVEYIET
jgi:hypothetical protein